MLELLTRNRISPVAMEFGACSLRAAQVCRCSSGSGGGWRLLHWLNLEVEPASPEPAAPDYEAGLAAAFGAGAFSGRSAALVLSPPEVEYKLLDVPSAVLSRPAGELREALQLELDRQMPWPSAECEVAVWPVQPGATSNANAMVAAAHSSSVKKLLDLMAAQGLECVRAGIAPLAMAAACVPDSRCRSGLADGPGQIWAALDWGFRACRLYLLQGDRLVYARVMRGGGRELTESVARALHVEFRIAEQYKRIYGIRQTDRGLRSLITGAGKISEDALPGVLYTVLRPNLEALAAEIEKSYRFTLGRLPGAGTGPMYLVGGGARMQGLIDALRELLDLPVCVPDPQTALSGTPGRGAAASTCCAGNYTLLAPCVGAALLEVGR